MHVALRDVGKDRESAARRPFLTFISSSRRAFACAISGRKFFNRDRTATVQRSDHQHPKFLFIELGIVPRGWKKHWLAGLWPFGVGMHSNHLLRSSKAVGCTRFEDGSNNEWFQRGTTTARTSIPSSLTLTYKRTWQTWIHAFQDPHICPSVCTNLSRQD